MLMPRVLGHLESLDDEGNLELYLAVELMASNDCRIGYKLAASCGTVTATVRRFDTGWRSVPQAVFAAWAHDGLRMLLGRDDLPRGHLFFNNSVIAFTFPLECLRCALPAQSTPPI